MAVSLPPATPKLAAPPAPKPAAPAAPAPAAGAPTTTQASTQATTPARIDAGQVATDGKEWQKLGATDRQSAAALKDTATKSLQGFAGKSLDNGIIRRSDVMEQRVAVQDLKTANAMDQAGKAQQQLGKTMENVAGDGVVTRTEGKKVSGLEGKASTAMGAVDASKGKANELRAAAAEQRGKDIKAEVDQIPVDVAKKKELYQVNSRAVSKYLDSIGGRPVNAEQTAKLKLFETARTAAFKELTFETKKADLVSFARTELAAGKGSLSKEVGAAYDTKFAAVKGAQQEADSMHAQAAEAKANMHAVSMQGALRRGDIGAFMSNMGEVLATQHQGNAYRFDAGQRDQAAAYLPYHMPGMDYASPALNRSMYDMNNATNWFAQSYMQGPQQYGSAGFTMDSLMGNPANLGGGHLLLAALLGGGVGSLLQSSMGYGSNAYDFSHAW
jgi:hypothetical protein